MQVVGNMIYALIGYAVLCAIALSGWTLAELELRDEMRAREQAEFERDVALGWVETQIVTDAVVQPTLHVVDGGEAS